MGKKEKRSWQYIEMPDNTSGLSRAELATNIRNEWLAQHGPKAREPVSDNGNAGVPSAEAQKKEEEAEAQSSEISKSAEDSQIEDFDEVIRQMQDYRNGLYDDSVEQPCDYNEHTVSALS